MKRTSIRISQQLWHKVRDEALSSGLNESVAFLTAEIYETEDKIVLIADNLVPAKKEDYLRRGELHLLVSPLYTNRLLNIAEAKKQTVIMVHSHPFETGKPQYSITDDYGEALTSETISNCLENNPPVGSLLVGQAVPSARCWSGLSKKTIPADITIAGGNKLVFEGANNTNSNNIDLVDRQVRAIGMSAQAQLECMEIGIVGLGGTGSIIAEQLVRMGVKKLWLVDNDVFEPSNWSRLYGSTWENINQNQFKVDIVKAHLNRINPNTTLIGIKKSVMTKEALQTLANCNVIFSCLDRHAPRAVINELSYQCFIPVIDVGVGIQRDHDNVIGGAARATLIGPEMPCLFCQEIVRPEMITAEHLSPEEYESRRGEGYVPTRDHHVPSVISYTSFASSLGLMVLLDFISEKGVDSYSSLLFDLQTKRTMKLRSNIKKECVCKNRLGKGLSVSFSVAD